MTANVVRFEPDGETLRAFMRDDTRVRIICGPFGSGKSVACAVEVFRLACQQAPGPDKVRRSRWMIVRSTYPQLKRTTISTWQSWFDDRFGKFTWGPPPSHRIIMPLPDATVLDLDVQFVALDGPTAEADLKGFEGTGIWLNEVSEIPVGVYAFARGRVGRFPKASDGGPTWYGIIGDTNPPDNDHWLFKAAEEEKPAGFAFFRQPGGVVKVDGVWRPNPDAENLKHLPLTYYADQLAGQSEDFIKVYLGAEYGYALDGKPVYPEWSDSSHVAPEPLAPIPELPLYIGLDFGLTPAAVFGQRTARGQWRILDELVTEDMGAVRFAEMLSERLGSWYGEIQHIEAWGDPAGNARSATDERSCLKIVADICNIPVKPAPTNEPTIRREAVAGTLNRMVDGMPGFLLSPACRVLRKGFSGGYHYKRVKVAGDDRYHDRADKNAFSHPHDALQYLLSGAGEARVVMRQADKRNMARQLPSMANSRYSPFRWRAGT